ncbi:MAG: BamA/TamA family outer membrane protein [Bacteroidetes bacterium]|nr:BamA/TamA family outer membrane protein [Bacteroidota bacterium]
MPFIPGGRLVRYSLAFLLVLTSGTAFSQQIPESETGDLVFINRVYFDGLTFFDESDLADEIQTRQNSWFISKSIKPGLFWYRVFDAVIPDSKISFIAYLKNYLKTNLGEAPSYYYEPALADDIAYLETYYKYFGYFRVQVDTLTKSTKDGKNISFTFHENQRAVIKSIVYEFSTEDNPELRKVISNDKLVAENQGYSVFDIRNERDRILTSILTLGYSFTTSDSISVIADTTGFPNVSLKYIISPSLQTITDTQSMYIYTNKSGVDTVIVDTLKSKGFQVFSTEMKELAPEILIRHVELTDGKIYSPLLRTNSIRNLTELGVFSSVNMSIDSVVFMPEVNRYRVFPNYQLRMSPKHEIRPEIRIDSKSDGSFGAGLIYSNKNIFHTAENLRISVGGSVQLPAKWTGSKTQYSEWNLNGGIDLNFPYFFGTRNRSQIGIKGQQASKVDNNAQYDLTILSTGLRIQWKHATYTRSFIDLIELNWVKADKAYFDKTGSKFIQDPYLNSVFRWTVQRSNTDIIEKNYGGIQEFTFEESGTLPKILSLNVDQSSEKRSANGKTGRLFGLDFYQYSKFYFDHRQYLSAGKKETVAFKLFAGYIFPYGVSTQTPTLNRFFGGGITSLRAWGPASLGPGSVIASNLTGYYDIKLESSVEYRKKWNDDWGYVLFADFGNLWNRAGSEGAFTLTNFWKEIAADYGVGLRYFLPIGPARIDFAWKAYDPAKPAGKRWVPNSYRLNDFSGYIKQMSFYIGIGHSF